MAKAKRKNPKKAESNKSAKDRSAARRKPPLTHAERVEREARRAKRTRLALIITAAVAAAAILTLAVIGIVNAVLAAERMDVMNDDLTKYIRLSSEDYKNVTLDIKSDPIDATAVESAFIEALYKARSIDPTLGATRYPVKDGLPRPIGIGDVVTLRYLGYTLGEGGEKIYFDGGCNFAEEYATELGIGSGQMINGFETGLVGKNPSEYSMLGAREDKVVRRGDAVVVTLLAMYSDGSTAKKQSYTVIADPDVADAKWGGGFADFLIGKKIGQFGEDGNKLSFTTDTVSDKTGLTAYADITIDKIYTLGESPLTVDAYFPLDYSSEELAGKWAKFDIYAEKVQYFSVPAVDESFVSDKLKMTVEQLRAYGGEGDSLEACYRKYLKSNLEAAAEAQRDEAAVGAFWDYVVTKAKVKRLPGGDVKEYYESYLSDLTSYYKGQADNYSSLDEFACTYLELEQGSDWRDALYENAELAILQRIIFYYIVRENNLTPTEEEYNAIFENIVSGLLEDGLRQLGVTEDKYDTKEEYEAEVQKYREMIIEGYGETYFKENVLYEHAMPKIVALALGK